MGSLREIVNAYDVERVNQTYNKLVEITNLRDEFGSRGHILVIRGDKAFAEELGDYSQFANPKFWLYESLLGFERIQKQLLDYPHHRLFDGVGYSALEALAWHSKRLGCKATVVMAHETLPNNSFFDRYDNVEVINADGPMEEGYVKKQAEVLSKRKDLIPLHQALYGAEALAPLGNKIAFQLEQVGIIPDITLWTIASGSNLYGIGRKIKQRFPKVQTMVVEPEINPTIDPSLDLTDNKSVKLYARQKLERYKLDEWNRRYSGVFPLHVSHPNRYLLLLWSVTGNVGFDEVRYVPTAEILGTQERVRQLNLEYDWTKTTALCLAPAIELANEGKTVLVMAYGKNHKHRYRDLIINER